MKDLEVRFGNAPNVPRLGDPRRVPSYAYPNWGLTTGAYRTESDGFYVSEWEGGSPKQMEVVVKAITESGLGNFSQMLRDANTRAVAALVRRSGVRLNYMEFGAGESTRQICQYLIEQELDPQRLFITMVEPSKSRVETAATRMEELGLRRGRDFRVIVGRDVDIYDPEVTGLEQDVTPHSQDIVVAVASIHHHAYLGTAFANAYNSLTDGGVMITTDWHNPEWEHPARVYKALVEDYDNERWATKDEDLERFLRAYPLASSRAPEMTNEGDAAAMTEIRAFWKSYGNIKAGEMAAGTFAEADDILMLEGHRPVERQIKTMNGVGFKTSPANRKLRKLLDVLELDDNPHQLRPESRLLMETVGMVVR